VSCALKRTDRAAGALLSTRGCGHGRHRFRRADDGCAVRKRTQQSFESLVGVRRLRDCGREPFERRRRLTLALGQLR
jgi:hypothetical protein